MEILELPKSKFDARNMIIEYVSQDNDVYYKHVRIRNGIPLESTAINKREIKKMLKNLGNINSENMLYWDDYITPSNVHFCLTTEDNPTVVWSPDVSQKKKFLLNKNIYHIFYPNLLFVVNNKNLYVYYYEGTLSTKTKLHAAFLPNIHDDFNVCLGNTKNRTKIKTINDYVESYENRFFNSVFNSFHMPEDYSTLPFATFLEMSEKAPVSVSYFKEINNYSDVLKNIV